MAELSPDLAKFFRQMRAEDGVIVNGNEPKLLHPPPNAYPYLLSRAPVALLLYFTSK